MASKKTSSLKRSKAQRAASAKQSPEVRRLRSTVKQLRAKLARENQRWRLQVAKAAAAAKKARLEVNRRSSALRGQSQKLANQLKRMRDGAKLIERRRCEAVAQTAELRAAMRQSQQELRAAAREIKRLTLEASRQHEAASQPHPVPMEEPITSAGVRPVGELETETVIEILEPPDREPSSE